MRYISVALLLLATLAASGEDSEPRLGPVYVLQITAPNPQALHTLIDSGRYNVSSVSGATATVYATPEERESLVAIGWPVVEIDAGAGGEKALGVYHSYATLTTDLQAYAALYPAICRLESLGQSYEGCELWALLITDNPDFEEDEPECKFVGTMHGNEPVGMELCLYLIDLLLTQYGADPRIGALVDNTALWIMPLMNPDGLTVNSRFSGQDLDLNRNFPNYPGDFTGTIFDSPVNTAGLPPEIAAVINWAAAESFTLAANFHTGSLVVNYPYDYDQLPSGTEAPSPDDDLFIDISLRYSIHNPPMWNSPQFPNGITNGSDWYAITGGFQDWDYRFAACNHVTVELSNTFKPAESTLAQLWEDNREAMLAYLESAHIGARGIVTDAETGAPVYAKVRVEGNTQPVFTDPDVGDYHRMLLPGVYTLVVSAPGYVTQRLENVVVTDGAAAVVDVQLEQQPMPQTPFARLLLMLLLAIFGLRFLFGKSAFLMPLC